MKTNILKTAFIVLLVLALSIPVVSEVKADEKPTLSNTEMTIGLGKYEYSPENIAYSKNEEGRYTLFVENSKKGATYTFSSSNKKVATVKKDGTKAYITGVKAGKATITVKQKLKNKTTTVGKCKVMVKQTKLNMTELEEPVYIGTQSVGMFMLDIDNFNPEAKYTYKTDSKNLKVTDERQSEGGDAYTPNLNIVAKKAGTYKVTMKETYQKKTRTVGTFKVIVISPSIEEEITMHVGGEDVCVSYLIYNYYENFWYQVGDTKMLKDYTAEEDGYIYVEALKAGETKIDFYQYDSKTEKKGDLLGSCKVIIKAE